MKAPKNFVAYSYSLLIITAALAPAYIDAMDQRAETDEKALALSTAALTSVAPAQSSLPATELTAGGHAQTAEFRRNLSAEDFEAILAAHEESLWTAALAKLFSEEELSQEKPKALPQELADIHALVEQGDTQELKKILASQPVPDVNAPDERGRTPLHIAVCHENPATAQQLLEHGADPDCPSPCAQTPRQMAFECSGCPGSASALVYKWPKSPTTPQRSPHTPPSSH